MKHFSRNHEGKSLLKTPRRRSVLKCFLKDVTPWNRFVWYRKGVRGEIFKGENGPSDFINGKEFLDHVFSYKQ
jgi:hypothetical protein